jgi:hypothetical protein
VKQALHRLRIALNLAGMTDAELLQLVVAIVALAPQSALMNVAAIASSVAALGTKSAAFKTVSDEVAADEEKLRNDKTAKLAARGVLENEVTSLAGLVGANAKDAAEAATLAFKVRTAPPVAMGVPEVPEAVDVVIPKRGHNKCKVSVHETGTTHGRYVAEWSPDPIGPTTWASLPGTGKSRTITGASGTKVWVRFARVRAQLQGGWSTPVLVTIP